MSTDNHLTHNINFLMEYHNISPNILSKNTGIGVGTIYQMKYGTITNPTVETITPIAKFFNFSVDEIVRIKIQSINPKKKSLQLLPLIPVSEIDNFPNASVIRYVNTDFEYNENKYCFEVQENNLIFDKNSIIIVDINLKYSNLDFVIVKNKKENIISLKQIIFDDKFFLKSIIKNMEFKIFDINEYCIKGVIIGYIKYFKET